MDYKAYSMEFAGRTLTLEFGKYAQQAGGSCLVRYGDTAVLCTVTASEKPREGVDYFPLGVDYEEKMYSVGRIPGSFLRREGKASEHATLTARCIELCGLYRYKQVIDEPCHDRAQPIYYRVLS